MPADIQIISPHRDDAALSLCLSMQHWLRHGLTVCIVNCFTRSSFSLRTSRRDLEAISAIRLGEDQALLRLLGRGVTMIDLGHTDYPDRPGWTPELQTVGDRPLDRAERREIDALANTLASRLGSGPILLPSCTGPHRDHLIAVHAALRARTDQPVAIYDDIPYTQIAGPAAAESRVRELVALFGLTLHPIYLGDKGDLPRKRAALEVYPSQLTQATIDAVIEHSRGGERLWVDERSLVALQPETAQP